MKFPDSQFWNYSTQMYQLPEVEQACLKLQNSFNVDINLLLFCCWAGDRRLRLSLDDILVLILTSSPWQDSILKPLRNARKTVKQHIIAMPAELLNQTMSDMKEMEINAEHLQQLELEKALDLQDKLAETELSAVEVTAANLSLYYQQLETLSSINDISADTHLLLNAIYQDNEAVQAALMVLAR